VYAIVYTGGKQYKISVGDRIRVEKMQGKTGDIVELREVLLYAEGEKILAGQPLLPNAKIVGEILGQQRAKKVTVFKMKRRKGYARKKGHRQSFTTLKIKEIHVQ